VLWSIYRKERQFGRSTVRRNKTMARILHINASPREGSRSLAVARDFLATYQEKNPGDTVETLNLFEAKLMPFDGAVMEAKYAVLNGGDPTGEQREAWDKVIAMADHLKSFDMWNFGVPYVLKQYIDILTQPGITFSYTPEEGYKGLVTGKKAFVAYARGGEYPEGTDAAKIDHQKPWFNFALNFIGITDIVTVDIEGTLYGREIADARTAAASEVAKTLVSKF
jgi:FMN-dependent NADH-azoreductase